MYSQQLRIVLVTNNYTPYSGGVVSSLNTLVNSLHRVGHKVCLITLDFLDDHQDDPPYVTRVSCPVKFKYKKNYMAIPWRATAQVEKIVRKFKPDIIHTQHPFLLGTAALSCAQHLHIPIVFTYHTIYEAYAHYLKLPQVFTRPMIKHSVLSFCNKVNGIVVPSSALQTYVHDHGIKKPVTVIPSSLQDIFLSQKPVIKKRKQGRPLHLLVVSRFVKEKNIPFVLDVAARLHSVSFVMTLVGYGAEYKALQAYAYEELGLSYEQVRFIYQPDKAVLVQQYSNADIFLFPSHSDTQGLVLAEAMAGGTPVIAVDGPGQRDIIEYGRNGFLVNDEAGMIAAIEQVAYTPHLYETLQKYAWQTAQKYRSERIIEKVVSFYNHVSNISKK